MLLLVVVLLLQILELLLVLLIQLLLPLLISTLLGQPLPFLQLLLLQPLAFLVLLRVELLELLLMAGIDRTGICGARVVRAAGAPGWPRGRRTITERPIAALITCVASLVACVTTTSRLTGIVIVSLHGLPGALALAGIAIDRIRLAGSRTIIEFSIALISGIPSVCQLSIVAAV